MPALRRRNQSVISIDQAAVTQSPAGTGDDYFTFQSFLSR